MDKRTRIQQCELILGNSNKRFSGVTSTMLQTMNIQKSHINLVILGEHHIDDRECVVGFWDLVCHARSPLPNGRPRVFHARRNDEMIQALLLRLLGVPLNIIFTSTAQRFHSGFTKWLMSKVDHVISTCSAAASYLEKPPEAVIPHGITTDTFNPAEDRAAQWESLGLSGKFGIGQFGRVREQKGVHLLVRASIKVLPKYPDFTTVIGGAISDDNREFVNELKAEIAQAGLSERIVFIGEQPFAKVPGLFSAMTVVTALSRNEGFGLTVLEAMSTKAAVIATQAGAWEDIIRPGVDGEIVPTERVDQLAEKLSSMLANPAKLVAMGEAGRERVLAHYTIEREAQELINFYEKAQKSHNLTEK